LLRLAKRLQGEFNPDRLHVVSNAQNLDSVLKLGADRGRCLALSSLRAPHRPELTCDTRCLVRRGRTGRTSARA